MKAKALPCLLACALLLRVTPVQAWDLFRSQSSAVERGNEHLSKGQHKEALEAYDEAARELPNDPAVQLDRGLALLGLGKLGEAREAFRRAGAGSAPKDIRGPALYDLGSTFMQEADQAAQAEDLDGAHKLLEEAVDAFRSSLRAQPNNKDAAWNFEIAKRRLVDVEKKQEEKKKQEEEKKKDEEKKDEQDKDKDKGPSDDENKDDKKEPQPDAGSPKGDDDEPSEQDGQGEPDAGAPKQPEPQQGPDAGTAEPPPPQEAEQQPAKEEPNALPEHMKNALDALEAGEENLEKQRAKQRARQRPRRIEKDW